jgi:hypothetical protein
VNYREFMTRVFAWSLRNAVVTIVPVGADHALVTNAENGVVTAIADGVVTDAVAPSQRKFIGNHQIVL